MPGKDHMSTYPCLPKKNHYNPKAIALNTNKGFSLTELMVVIAIIGIMAVVAVPAFNHYAVNANLKTAARDLVSDIVELKERAIAENRQYMIEFMPDSNQYTINQGTYGGGPYNVVQTRSLSNISKDIRISNVVLGSGRSIFFATRGFSSPAGNITLTNSHNSTAVVRVTLSGRAYAQFNMQ